MKPTILASAVVFTAIGTSGWLQPGAVERDVFFHAAIARDYSTSLFLYESRITEGALERYPADREPLYHLLLSLPIRAGVDPVAAAMGLSALCVGLISLTVLASERSLLVALCGVMGSSTGLFRLLMGRPQALAVFLCVLGTVLLLKGRWKWALLVNVVYTLSYSVPVVLLGIAFLLAIERRRPSIFLSMLVSSCVGLALHPHFPHNLFLLWYQGVLVPWNAATGNPLRIDLPGELRPVFVQGFLVECWLPLSLVAVGLVRRSTGLTLGAAQAIFLLLTFRMGRFVEYFMPFASLRASATLEWISGGRSPGIKRFLALLLLGALLFNAQQASAGAERQGAIPQAVRAARWMEANRVEGHVFNARWDAYPALRYFCADRCTMVQGLDPMFVAAHSPERQSDIRRAVAGHMSIDEFRALFGARWILCGRTDPILGFSEHPSVRVRYADDEAVLLEMVTAKVEE